MWSVTSSAIRTHGDQDRPAIKESGAVLITMSPDGQRLEVVVGDAHGRAVRVPGLSSWLRSVAPAGARGRVGIALVSDRRIRALNRTYRGKDHVTDVLSFPA